MSVNLYDSVNQNGLFNLLGKAFKVQTDVNTSRGTTIPTDLLNVVAFHNKLTPTDGLEQAIQPVSGAIPGYQTGGNGTVSLLQSYAQNLVVEMVNADSRQTDRTLKTALTALIAQMVAASASVESSTATITATAGGSNAGTGVLLVSKKRGDGATQESLLAETITATVSGTGAAPTVGFASPSKAGGTLGADWPAGSGISRNLAAIDATSGSGTVLVNGGFETFTVTSNVPDGWILTVGIPGTTCLATVNEVQTVVISGAPTGGWYALKYTSAAGKVYQTAPLSFDAADATVQAALRALPDLAQVTVVATGTSPNYTHTITFTGRGGDPSQLTSLNNLTGGTSPAITHATTTAGTSQVLAGGSAWYFASNGTELTTLQQAVQLQPSTAYAVSLWACADSVPGAGVLTIDLVDGVGGSVLADNKGASNSLTIAATGLTTGWKHLKDLQASECVFRTPAVLPTVVFFRVRISTAVTSSRKIYLDSLALAPMAELYSGGPLVAVMTGGTNFAPGDTWSIVTTNDRAGLVREWCERNFGLATLGLALPTSASPTIPDSVVS